MLRTASFLQSAGIGPDTFAGMPAPGAPATAGQGPAPSPTNQPEAQGQGGTPFGMVDPNMLQQLFGGYGGLPNALGGPGNSNAPNPGNTRSPEERYEEQLAQLREMGFVNATQNVRALMATGGNVQMAIEYILGGGGL
jgi:ubiquilin